MNTSNPRLYVGALKTAGAPRSAVVAPGAFNRERYFKIPQEFLPAVKAWVEEGAEGACHAKNASAIVFVRDGRKGLETILTYRPGFSPMGTVSFPGGLSIPTDAENTPWLGPSDEVWRDVFQHENTLLAHAAVVGAVREAFEETGILLAGSDEQSIVEMSNDGHDLMAIREAIAQGDKNFGDFLTKRGLKIRTDLLRPIVRWHSPDFRHKRYDTHFFACAAPIGQNPKLLDSKGIWGEWVNVKELLENKSESHLGDLIGQEETRGKSLEELITPGSLCVLEDLAQASTSIAYLAKKRAVQVKKADVVLKDGEYMLRFTAPTKAGIREKCKL